MHSNLITPIRLKALTCKIFIGIFSAAITGYALADVSSWVSTTAPDITPDPGAAGTLSTYGLEYSVGANSSTIGQHGILVGPTDAFGAQEAIKRPLVVFVHGDHARCLIDGVPSDPNPYVSCPPANRVPSYKGYLGLQRRLATRGYISISIDANEIARNATALQAAPDAHISLLKSWTDSRLAPNLFLFGAAQNTDFSKVVLVGHSVGAVAVNDAAFQNKIQQASGTSMPVWNPVGQILISGGGSEQQAATLGVHTLNWLSECDNVNVAAQGMLDKDIHHDYVTLRSSILVRGANHNYSNSVWTDDDDDYGQVTNKIQKGLECGFVDANGQPITNTVRLSLNDQQTITKSYFTAAVAAFVSNDVNAWKAIDGTPGHLPSSGVAGATGPEIRVSGKGRRRNDFVQISLDTLNVAASNPDVMTANLCDSSSCTSAAGISGAQRSQFWIAGSSSAVSVKWTGLGSKVSLAHKSTVDGGLLGVMPAHRQLGLRIAQLPSTGALTQSPISLNVTIRDIGSHTLDLGTVTVNPLVSLANTGPIWAQEVRVPVPAAKGFDFTSIVSLDLTPLSPSTGQIWVSDAFGYLPN
ncbi:hypothetical protein [Aquabacterium sp. NJ1]|uniref:hypothetical protein n=1 Tax=Aquabacterium sp. NJ1 TaxID=1538295 RepID=UPI000ADA6CE0|nr:hypothetical protein [Aquabacterium sp. NJ1]